MKFNFASFDMPVVRSDLVNALDRLASSDMVHYPVRVNSIAEQYEILNVTRRQRCLDEEKSDVSYWTERDGRPEKVGQYRVVVNTTIDKSLAEDRHIFRLEGWLSALIVSEPVKELIESFEDHGVIFVPVD